MTHILAALASGLMFGAGLAVSGMIDPQKILGFFDVAGIKTGAWDPTLGVVFAAALVPMFIAYALQRRMGAPVLGGTFQLPTRTDIDARLVTGAAVFGVGWGLAGLCPGPALAALPAVKANAGGLIVFIAAMIAGILLSKPLGALFEERKPVAFER